MSKTSFGTGAVVAVALVLWLALDHWARTLILHWLHLTAPVTIPLAAIALVLYFIHVLDGGRAVAWVLLIALSVGTITYWVTYSYESKRAYLSAVETVDDGVPDFAERAPYPVAVAKAKPLLGDVRGTIEKVRFVTDGDEDSFNALVTKPGFLTGYQVLEHADIEPNGDGEATTCKFSESATKKIHGRLMHSLDRSIAAARPGSFFDGEDAYGYCDDEKAPIVVVPLKKLAGLFHITEVPAGVALYNGNSGRLEMLDSVEDGEIPGPVFPTSLAAKLRAATEATGSFTDYLFSRAGYESTDGDDDDPNAGNTTEFALRTADGKGGVYATPLTPKGSAQTIVALGVISSSSVKSGEWNTLTVHRYSKSRVPGSTVAQTLRGDYGDLPEWAAGMGIFEVTPLSQTQWVASLGQNQDVSYRVLVNANGSSCLERADGSKIRCGKATGPAGSPGAGGDNSSRPVAVPDSVTELDKLSDDELATLQRQLTDELLARLTTTS